MAQVAGALHWETLADGFSFRLRNHFFVISIGAGGVENKDEGWMDMLPPVSAPDDADHYRVNFSGYYARYNLYVDSNELQVSILGSWTNPSKVGPHFLLTSPLGYRFGTFDGSALVLDPITVELHLPEPVPVWSVKL